MLRVPLRSASSSAWTRQTTMLELQRLHPTDHRPMLANLDPADRPEGRVCPPAAVDRLPFDAVPDDEQHLVEPLIGLEAWVADPPLLSIDGLDALEGGGEHHVEAAEGLLLSGKGLAAMP